MKAREVTSVTSPERAGAHLLLAGEPLAAEALRVADDRVDPGVLDDLQHLGGLRQIRRERLLDQQRNAALGGREDRLDMQVLIGGDDRAVDLGSAEQLDMALRDEIRTDLAGDFAGAVRVLFGQADPFHGRMTVRDLAAEQPDASAADDRDAEFFCLRSQLFNPARIFCLNSAICEIVWLVSGRSTGSFRSAERSAAE